MKAINVILALLVSFGLAFGVAELGLRLLGFAPPAINTEFDANLGWRKAANSTIERSTPEYDVTIRTDALGLRDDYAAQEIPAKPEGTTRMIFLGDSFTLGYTVEREDLFVDLVEKAWRDEGRKVEIINAGTQAYSTDQALAWLEENGAAFDPDVVVLFPYENDIWWNAQDTYLGQPKPLYDQAGKRTNPTLEEGARRGWFGKTAVGNLLRKKAKLGRMQFGGGSLTVEQSSQLIAPPESTQGAEARTLVLTQAMSDRVQAMGAEFVICPIPSRAAVSPPEKLPAGLDPNRPYQLFCDAAKASPGTGLILSKDALTAAVTAGWTPYYKRDFHLNAQGNLVLAEVVKTALEGAGHAPAAPEGLTEPAHILDMASSPEPPASPKKMPRWPFFYAGLVAALGTLYSRSYPDESAGLAYAKVAGLLGVVFATALGVTALMGVLPPLAAKLVLIALVISILTFVLYKLGDRVGTITELMKAFTLRGHWYLMPLLTVLLTVGSLLVVAASSPLVAPFIYTLF